MARAQAEKVGRGLCPSVGCGAPVTYRQSTGGMLKHKCDACDSAGYCEPGGAAYKARMATIEKPADPAPGPDPAPEPPTPPTAKRGNFAFNL